MIIILTSTCLALEFSIRGTQGSLVGFLGRLKRAPNSAPPQVNDRSKVRSRYSVFYPVVPVLRRKYPLLELQ